jgi:hypothetical protein
MYLLIYAQNRKIHLGKARLAPTKNEWLKTAEIRSNAKSYSWNFENKQCHYPLP